MANLRETSVAIIQANQAASGAYIASPTFSQYGYSWLRDGTWIAHSMNCIGEHDSAEAFHRWVSLTLRQYETQVNRLLQKLEKQETLEETDYLPTRFTINSERGGDDWPDFQLDGYGAWLWGVVFHCEHHNPALWEEVRPAVILVTRYIAALWRSPNYDCWEEFRHQVHLSTLAALYGGLEAVHQYDKTIVPVALPDTIRDYVLSHGIALEGHFIKFIGNPAVDASLLWLAAPFGLVDVRDIHFTKTLAKIEADLHRPGGGVYRYQADTYFGGGEWLLLSTWLAWVYIELGRIDEAQQLIEWVEAQTTANGEMPEQTSDHLLDASHYQSWVERWGNPACPLLWSHAMYLIVQSAIEGKKV